MWSESGLKRLILQNKSEFEYNVTLLNGILNDVGYTSYCVSVNLNHKLTQGGMPMKNTRHKACDFASISSCEKGKA